MSHYKSVVLAKINANNQSTYTDADLSIGLPQVSTNASIPRNTWVQATALVPSGKVGKATLYYDRHDLATFVDGRSLRFVVDAPATSQDLLAAFNERFSTLLESGDIVSEALPDANADGAIVYEFKIAAGCYGFTGKVTLTIVEPPPAPPIP